MVASNDYLLARVQKHLNGFGLTGDLAVGIKDLVFGLLVADDLTVRQQSKLLRCRAEDQLQAIGVVIAVDPPSADCIGI